MSDFLNAGEVVGANMTAGGGLGEICNAAGHYEIECHDADGNTLWSAGFDNLVPTVGLNQLLASGVVGSGPSYMGLISSTSFGTIVATDTMLSHSGWLEADASNAPEYTGNRPTLAYGTLPANGVIATTSTNSFVFSASGTVQGGFIVAGPGASATQANTGGVLMSAGTIGTPQPVISGNTITMSYTLTL
jgi:hypothetical protein